ncbi:hypothetical protein J4N45_23400 [Vibrio sp. SCSIO 43140]|uniref:hypothetical protein n=1 Tax=Vibrio sp. SCSIO 43140 TaxID=2819100 RepID=UPI00207579E2|nr:hypothetical protein [Vibrio sp. SCSIO 43140]USD62323.1 hypothetical protein J4N45_23400 [Vibrio sp. SCSIO 43140]
MNGLTQKQVALIRHLGQGAIVEVVNKASPFDPRTWRTLIGRKLIVYLKTKRMYRLTARGERVYSQIRHLDQDIRTII